MPSEKKILWLEDEGTYNDQFDTEKECTIIRQQVVVELINTKTRKGGYDQPVRRYIYEDPLGRRFVFVNDGVSYYQGRTYSPLDGKDYQGTWKSAKKFERCQPYLTPDGQKRVEIMNVDHENGYEFYEKMQLEIALE